MSSSGSFSFLAKHSPPMADLGATAKRLFPFDPASCVPKLWLLAKALTQDIAARLGIQLIQPTQAELLRAGGVRLRTYAQGGQLFKLLLRNGNLAAYEAVHGIGDREGIEAPKAVRLITIWIHRSFSSRPGCKPRPFKLSDDTCQRLLDLRQRIAQRLEAPSSRTGRPSLQGKAFRCEPVPQGMADGTPAQVLKRMQSSAVEKPLAGRPRHHASAASP